MNYNYAHWDSDCFLRKAVIDTLFISMTVHAPDKNKLQKLHNTQSKIALCMQESQKNFAKLIIPLHKI